jgi:hypothetical protein
MLLGQQKVRSSQIRSEFHNAFLPGPHVVPSYSVFRTPIYHNFKSISRSCIQTHAISGSLNPPRVFGVSDIHTDYIENFKWAESLDKEAFRCVS